LVSLTLRRKVPDSVSVIILTSPEYGSTAEIQTVAGRPVYHLSLLLNTNHLMSGTPRRSRDLTRNSPNRDRYGGWGVVGLQCGL